MTRGGVGGGLSAVLLIAATATASVAKAEAEQRDPAAVAESLGIARRIASAPTGLAPAAMRALGATIVRAAWEANLDPLLVAAVIEVESSFRPRAVSRAGALGLMQVMPRTGAWLAERSGRPDRGSRAHLLEPEWNVALGVAYLAHLIERFGRIDEALVAYNAGPTRARAILASEQRTRWLDGYPRRVLALRDRYHRDAARLEDAPSRTAETPSAPSSAPGR